MPTGKNIIICLSNNRLLDSKLFPKLAGNKLKLRNPIFNMKEINAYLLLDVLH